MNAIKPIETKYKGYRFRSRLEARWAVFFERLGAEWRYEAQGYQKEEFKYLPDFEVRVGDYSYFVEVKGNKDWLFENREMLSDMHDYGGILPRFADSAEPVSGHGGYNNTLLILGEVPEPKRGVLIVTMLGHHEGVHVVRGMLSPYGVLRAESYIQFSTPLRASDYNIATLSRGELDFQPACFPALRGWQRVVDALAAARAARFEHGEQP